MRDYQPTALVRALTADEGDADEMRAIRVQTSDLVPQPTKPDRARRDLPAADATLTRARLDVLE
jgi:hypothetical protein